MHVPFFSNNKANCHNSSLISLPPVNNFIVIVRSSGRKDALPFASVFSILRYVEEVCFVEGSAMFSWRPVVGLHKYE